MSRLSCTPVVTVVTTTACHYCTEALRVLRRLETEESIGLEVVDALSVDGARLIHAHRPAMFPLVLLDDTFFSAGRLPQLKLTHRLSALAGAV